MGRGSTTPLEQAAAATVRDPGVPAAGGDVSMFEGDAVRLQSDESDVDVDMTGGAGARSEDGFEPGARSHVHSNRKPCGTRKPQKRRKRRPGDSAGGRETHAGNKRPRPEGDT